ncbi:hypothetical protein GBAR_LOCUS29118 [Geodia barretti]|uniref:Uncharacterized protein n=1 Tax=Geodia barretti TaxID=519541 RepID=A0AA35XIX0_GEOBA|nr:hypothetical protein GBAR_LOCUS29118 [Geodia barretti]
MSLTEKDLSVDSQDEDSGHDSADSLSAGPVDDRERIVHLETAVAWIKEEMVRSKNGANAKFNAHICTLPIAKYGAKCSETISVTVIRRFYRTSGRFGQGIHEIREIHRKQLEAEQKFVDANFSTPHGHRQLRRTSRGPSESPTSPISPLSPPPSITRLSASAFNLKDPLAGTANSSDSNVLENFFGSNNMSKLNAVLWQSTDSLTRTPQRKSQSTDKLLSANLPPLPEKKRRSISRSPKNSLVHASTPDMSSLRGNNEGMSDIGVEMKKLRMRLRETANQTVAEIEEKFSPTFNRLTLGPAIDLLQTTPPMILATPTREVWTASPVLFPPGVVSVAPHRGTGVSAPFLHRSPTPPHQQSNPHARHPSLSSSNVSGLITTCYQNQQDQSTGYHHHHHQRPAQPQPYEVANGIPVGSHGRRPPPSMSRQYSPGTQSGVNGTGGTGHPPPEQAGYVYSSGRSNGGRVYASNPNLLSGGGADSSTHYSTAVIKKRRSSGTKNGAEPQSTNHAHYGGRTHEYDVLHSPGYAQNPHQHQSHGQVSNPPHRMGRTHSPNTHYTPAGNGKIAHPNSYHSQRSVPPSTSETNLKEGPRQIKPNMSTGELRASMRHFQYVPFAEQKRSLAVGRGRSGQQHDPENTWL